MDGRYGELSEDPFWAAIEVAIPEVKRRPNLALSKPWWPDGLNGNEVNRLGQEHGLGRIIDERTDRDEGGKPYRRLLIVHRPGVLRPLELLVWQSGPQRRLIPDDADAVVVALRSWQQVRAGQLEQPRVVDAPEKELPTLRLDPDKLVVTLPNGSTEALTGDQARVLRQLIEARGGWCPSEDLKIYEGTSERPRRIIGNMPDSVQRLIAAKSGPGGGSRLTVPGVVAQ